MHSNSDVDLLIEKVGGRVAQLNLEYQAGVPFVQPAEHRRQNLYAHDLRNADPDRAGSLIGIRGCRAK